MKGNKFVKPLSVEKVYQNFGLLIKKVVKFTEVFKYAITSVTLAVAVLNPTLCKPEKASLRNYIINLS